MGPGGCQISSVTITTCLECYWVTGVSRPGSDLVLDHYGEPDEWDVVVGSIRGPGRRLKRLKKRNIFPFIEREGEPDLE